MHLIHSRDASYPWLIENSVTLLEDSKQGVLFLGRPIKLLENFMIWLEFLVVLVAIIIGSRRNGVAMGFAGCAGIAVLTFVFGLKPASPPVDVLLIIISITCLAAAMQTAGGLQLLVGIAEKILRANPNRITIVAPMVTFAFTVLTGTAYVALAVYPVISEVALEAKVRVERPMSIACIAAQEGISASPVSAATAAIVPVMANTYGVTLGQMMLVLIPSIFVAFLIGAISVYRKGAELENDPEFQSRVASGELGDIGQKKEHQTYVPDRNAKISVCIFIFTVLSIVVLASFKGLLPSWEINGKMVSLSIPQTIEILAMSGALLIVLICNLKAAAVVRASVLTAGITGVISIFGVAWMASTFFQAHRVEIISVIGGYVQAYPWLFGVALFIGSALLVSQGATAASIFPIGASLGLTAPSLVAVAPAVNGLFFFPVSGTVIGALTFDRSGTTKVGKYVINHSFQRPGIVTLISSVCISYLMTLVVF